MMCKKNYNIYVGGGIVVIIILMVCVSIFWTPYDANFIDAESKFLAPNCSHCLGTDNFGRDILSRIMQGSVYVFIIGALSVLIGLLGGLILGAIAGYFGGWLDELIMRVVDVMMAIPGILFAIMLILVFDVGLLNTIIALGVPRIAIFTRVIRGNFLRVKTAEFVKSGIMKGATHVHIMWHHILPNSMTQIIVAMTVSFSSTILSESGLSYLGLGVQPPNASWGRMLSEAKPYILKAPWYMISVGVIITITVFGFNTLGDGLRQLTDNKNV